MEPQQQQQQRKQEVEECRPSIQEDKEQRGFDNSLRGADIMTIDQCETIREMDDSQLVGPSPAVAVVTRDVNMVDVQVATVEKVAVAATSTAKRKRGRPPRIQGKTGPQPPALKKNEDEEDVCFICFDGGSLVLCDRRGCPKAYHPACIKRDEAFFRSKAKWNCGWHICSSCQKASHYMCYTCTYSLCKGCTKDADYVCVRGNKGLCGTCMRIIMLIENISPANTEMVQVDFDDKTSWEYLFKVYWVYLKAKLSLTIDELTKAKNPWKGDELPKTRNSWKGACTGFSKEASSVEIYHGNNDKGSCLDSCYENVEANHSKRRKTKDENKVLNEINSPLMEKSDVGKIATLPEGTTWATKELLEFVAHMKNGDTSILSQFDVQGLLLEYVKRNNLRDPHQKSQIVCDSRLITLFGKPLVGHFEMLKLLEYHFLIKEKSPVDDADGGQLEAAGSNDSQPIVSNDRRRKIRKKMDERGPLINPNPDEYAAIDVHNINLLYLKRNLVENLMDDFEKFHEKVVGSFVRIRISGGDQKQDMYRLVQVVGTSKAAESYEVGTRTTNIMLEILNLEKKEVISIDGISSQEFSEDECRRLRQCVKCGLIKRLKVGEIQEKTMALQHVKVSDWLEAEISRLNHLRDRASEKGLRKELRECVEKLELLKSPKERERRLHEIPNIHLDPNMDPSVESEDAGESDEKKQGYHVRSRLSSDGRKGVELNSSPREVDEIAVGDSAEKDLAPACERNKRICTFFVDRDGTTRVCKRVGEGESTWSHDGGAFGRNNHDTSRNQLDATGLASSDWNGRALVQSESLPGVVIPSPLCSGREHSASDIETEKLWHYEDPFGKHQGPFSMIQLRKWNASGLFPPDFRVWRIDEKQDDSILLTEALVGQLPEEPPQHCNSTLLPQEATVASNDAVKKWEDGLSQSSHVTWIDGKGVDHDKKPVQNGDNDLVRCNELGSHSSTWTKAVDVAITNDAPAKNSLQSWDLPQEGKSWVGTSPSSSGKLFESLSLQAREGHGDEKLSSNPCHADENSYRSSVQTSTRGRDEKCKLADNEGYSSQSSGHNWGPQPISSSSSGRDSNSIFVSAAKSPEKSEQNQKVGLSDLPSPTAKHGDGELKGQATDNKLSVGSDVPVQDSGPSWSTASSLVVGGGQLCEVAGDWGGYSCSLAKPFVESNLVNASSLKPTEGVGDHAATPTSASGQLMHSSPHHPTIDTSAWQPIVPEPNEFCSLVDESVSDLLAEVEAMESLGGLPSPTSKMSCGGELTPGSDDDCFSPVEPFSPAPDQGRSDALSSTSDVQIPSQLTASNMPPHSVAPDEPLRASPMPSQSTVTEEPLGLWQTDVLNPQNSFSGHSSSSAEVEGDAKPSDVSVNQWETRSDLEPLASSAVNQGEAGSNIWAPTPSAVRQLEAGSDTQHSASSTADASSGTVKGKGNLNRVEPQGSAGMAWGTGHGSAQQQANSNPAISTNNVGSWGSQPRNGGDNRYSGTRDHRNHYSQGRDSGYVRDRSSWNRQSTYGFGGGGGGGSFKPQGKGQRVCKFYESGYCKKGASCSYWHPS
ncbi:zinc finger CCCH domain-containing protein 44 isoform X2 [Manihot esculenta]|uniref:Zinc finger CCCH domain-containing protein 44 n=1 Tax=Manihot esculenta TaxID=3983 RepID=A0A251LGN7_MANES|nr:zinc finger CCCH domain-containing protein 44 isoform X2 [Manihot esculenta]OAY57489.1 hypothetical protein MANES_02G101200v8 [Manihot esculenta]OAY57490.1 hypothetical protein MANES_02G101200v8 [Manihot esculenta]